MEYTAISAKLPTDLATEFKVFAEKKGLTPSMLIRELIESEMEKPMAKYVAGRNEIEYQRETDTFKWEIVLDSGEVIDMIDSANPEFILDLHKMLSLAIDERVAFIGQRAESSVAIPSKITRRKEE